MVIFYSDEDGHLTDKDGCVRWEIGNKLPSLSKVLEAYVNGKELSFLTSLSEDYKILHELKSASYDEWIFYDEEALEVYSIFQNKEQE